MSREETSRELCICRTRITYVKEAYGIDQNVINGHENPSDSHNYHVENHDEIEFHLENSDRSTWYIARPETRRSKSFRIIDSIMSSAAVEKITLSRYKVATS